MVIHDDYYAPLKSVNRRVTPFPWLTQELIEGSIKRDRLFSNDSIAKKNPEVI